MVVSTCLLRFSNAMKQTPRKIKRKFLDSLRLYIKAGAGGMGYQKYGGTGGSGGSIYALGKEGVMLRDIIRKNPSKRVVAACGENSHSRCIVGPAGQDIEILTPLGVSIYNEAGRKLGEIDQEGDKVLIAKGGVGGNKETGYSGLVGEKGVFTFDLKLIADIGLVGFPNAGKSTLLSALSNAKPKIASYPFTTLNPQLGKILYPDLRQISIADLPGLIEGAHVNIGLGHRFLKHVERTKLNCFVVDVGGFRLGLKYKPRNCLETIILLNKELEMYREDLVNTPAILIINKMDKPGADNIFKETCSVLDNLKEVFQEVPEEIRPNQPLRFEKVIGMSAISKNKDEIEQVKTIVREILDAEIDSQVAIKEKALMENIQRINKEYGPNML